MKRMIAMLLCAAMVLSMLCSAALAEPAKDKSLKNIKADVNNANREIKQLVRIAQATPEDDVEELLNKVDAIVARIRAHAAQEGVEVVCSMEEYWIDGRYVAIDPLMVVNIRQ